MSLAWFLQLDYDSSAPPEQAWRRRLNSHANLLKEFSVTFMEAIKMASVFRPLSFPNFQLIIWIRWFNGWNPFAYPYIISFRVLLRHWLRNQ